MDKDKSTRHGITLKGAAALTAISVLFILITVFKTTAPSWDIYSFFIRLFALWGYFFMAVALSLTPFLKEIRSVFGKPFLKIHHIFAYAGVFFIIMHPVALLLYTAEPAIFLPDFSSWQSFWALAGRPALFLLFIALAGVWLRRKTRYWRIIHLLMYFVLLMGFVHAVLIGTDFSNPVILIIFSIIFAFCIAVFIIKRVQLYRIAAKRRNKASK